MSAHKNRYAGWRMYYEGREKSSSFRYFKIRKNVQITLDEDMNVPDTRPDVEKIIESRGEVHIDEIEVLTDRLRLRKLPRADTVSKHRSGAADFLHGT